MPHTLSKLANSRRRAGGWAGGLAAMCLLPAASLRADTFSGAQYDPKSDELVVTIVYDGTTPDHQFSLHWGECQSVAGNASMRQIAVDVIDAQWQDVAKQSFTKTVRFSVAGLACRPAVVTLRTAPRYEITLKIP